jgi:hypothetical protein
MKTVIIKTVGGNQYETKVEGSDTYDVIDRIDDGDYFICNETKKDIVIPKDKIDSFEVLD